MSFFLTVNICITFLWSYVPKSMDFQKSELPTHLYIHLCYIQTTLSLNDTLKGHSIEFLKKSCLVCKY